MRVKSMAIALVVAALLAGCSDKNGTEPTSQSPSNGGGGGSAPEPCSLLTTAEATDVLGEPAKDGAPHSSTGTKQCQWDAVSGDASIAILIWVSGWRSRWDSTRETAKAFAKFADVSGLGDAAFSNGIDLHILKGDDMYQIGVMGPFSDPVPRATTVAQKALART